ncbi:MAG TPA: hypothetical protein VFN10_11020 [Thermoanaerobaculia bacterium]|nr:hypothetical protein [Thermoanaerobaculia bacterium]
MNDAIEPVSGVPREEVGAVVQDFVNGGVEIVQVRREIDGTYTISAG